MKKVLAVVAVLLCIQFTSVAQQIKIAVVSPDEIFSVMPDTKKADSSLAAFQKALQETYQEQEQELNAALEKFVKDSAKMSPAIKEAKRTDLQTRIQGLQEKQQKLNEALEEEKNKQIAPIRDKMIKAIQAVAKENGYTHVMYKEQLIVFPESEDITDKVKQKLGIKK